MENDISLTLLGLHYSIPLLVMNPSENKIFESSHIHRSCPDETQLYFSRSNSLGQAKEEKSPNLNFIGWHALIDLIFEQAHNSFRAKKLDFLHCYNLVPEWSYTMVMEEKMGMTLALNITQGPNVIMFLNKM